MKAKKMLNIVLSAVLCLSAGACGQEKTGTPKLTPPTFSEDKPMTFTAYMTPPQAEVGLESLRKNPDYMTPEQYGYIRECGFDSGIAIYEQYAETPKALELSEQAGIKYLVRDASSTTSIGGIVGYAGDFAADYPDGIPAEWANDIKTRMDAYKAVPSFGGIMASDEPGAAMFGNIAVAARWFEENYPGYEYYVNLLPYGAGTAQLGGYTGDGSAEKNAAYEGRAGYEKHLNEFIEIVKPQYLSYDYYAQSYGSTGNPRLGIMFLANLEIYANAAKANNLTFQNFLLTMGHMSYRTPSNYDDLAWQVYNAMAYGCRGFKTFTYWTTMSPESDITHGLIDHYGNRTQTYYSMQQLIAEVRAMEDAYNSFDWEETVAYIADEDYYNALYDNLVHTRTFTRDEADPLEGVSSMSGENDFLTGLFKDAAGNKAYMFSNLVDSAYDTANKITVTFAGADEIVIYRKGRTGQYRLNEQGSISFTLGSGEGAFVIPLYA